MHTTQQPGLLPPKADHAGTDSTCARSRTIRVTADRIVHGVAGSMVLASLALAHWHHPRWIGLTVFVGANLLQSGFTNWCLLSRILIRLAGQSHLKPTCTTIEIMVHDHSRRSDHVLSSQPEYQ